MKKIYSIGYKDSYGDFRKQWDNKGDTLKFATIEEAENYIKENLNNRNITNIKIMQGWKVIKEI